MSDATQVEAFCTDQGIPNELRSFIAGSRANAFACGWITAESVIDTVVRTAADSEGMLAAHAHILEAASLGLQVVSLATYITTVNFYNTNHNTGGTTLPAAFLRTIRCVLNLPLTVSDGDITTAVRLAGHASDKRITLRHFIELGSFNTGGFVQVPSYRPNYTPAMDNWALVRSHMQPAGIHIYGVLKETLAIVARNGLGGMSPVPEARTLLQAVGAEIEAAGPAAHPGARYLFGVDPVAGFQISEMKAMFGEIGGFLITSRKGNTITQGRSKNCMKIRVGLKTA